MVNDGHSFSAIPVHSSRPEQVTSPTSISGSPDIMPDYEEMFFNVVWRTTTRAICLILESAQQ